jgi:hypothetical protein
MTQRVIALRTQVHMLSAYNVSGASLLCAVEFTRRCVGSPNNEVRKATTVVLLRETSNISTHIIPTLNGFFAHDLQVSC